MAALVTAYPPQYARGSCPRLSSVKMTLASGARARNLHRCAVQIAENWNGSFPPSAEAIATLHGIVRSTPAAIAAFAYSERYHILDGNVKSVSWF